MVFLAGVLCKTGSLGYSLPLVVLTVWLAAFMGYQFGYWFGMRSRTFLLRQPDCWYYKRRNIALARVYYRRFGVYTILIGRYVPVVRTLAPILAGFIQVNAQQFLLLNLLSSTIWSLPFILAGYWLGTVIEIPLHYWMFALLVVLLVALLPLARRFFPQFSVSNKNSTLL
jgi:membrane-associated protein